MELDGKVDTHNDQIWPSFQLMGHGSKAMPSKLSCFSSYARPAPMPHLTIALPPHPQRPLVDARVTPAADLRRRKKCNWLCRNTNSRHSRRAHLRRSSPRLPRAAVVKSIGASIISIHSSLKLRCRLQGVIICNTSMPLGQRNRMCFVRSHAPLYRCGSILGKGGARLS